MYPFREVDPLTVEPAGPANPGWAPGPNALVTGLPGEGKTTLIRELAERLKDLATTPRRSGGKGGARGFGWWGWTAARRCWPTWTCRCRGGSAGTAWTCGR